MNKITLSPVRYDLSYGEMLASAMSNAKLPLASVVYALYGRMYASALDELKVNPFKLPEDATLTLHYPIANQGMATVSKEKLLKLTSEEANEIRTAILNPQEIDSDRRPVISYSCFCSKTGATARLVAAFKDLSWECVQAKNITYAEANFIYELLASYNFAH